MKRLKEVSPYLYMIVGLVAAFVLPAVGVSCAFAATPNGVSGHSVISPDVVTAQEAREASPDLLVEELQKKIVEIRPQGTPLFTIANRASCVSVSGQKYEYYSSDTLANSGDITSTANAGDEAQLAIESTLKDVLVKDETIVFPTIDNSGLTKVKEPLVAMVVGRNDEGKTIIIPVNGMGKSASGTTPGNQAGKFPVIAKGTKFVRASRCLHETAISTAPYASYPTKEFNYLQKSAVRVDYSTMMRVYKKEIDFSQDDVTREALYDHKRGIDTTYLIGSRSRIVHDGKELFYSGGIWNQVEREYRYNKAQFTAEELINILHKAFTKNNGSKRKTLICSTKLSTLIAKAKGLDGYAISVTTANRFDMTFSVIKSTLGELHVIEDELFDNIPGMEDNGIIIDESCLLKAKNDAFCRVQKLDLRASGVSDADAAVYLDMSCLILQNEGAHLKLMPAV